MNRGNGEGLSFGSGDEVEQENTGLQGGGTGNDELDDEEEEEDDVGTGQGTGDGAGGDAGSDEPVGGTNEA